MFTREGVGGKGEQKAKCLLDMSVLLCLILSNAVRNLLDIAVKRSTSFAQPVSLDVDMQQARPVPVLAKCEKNQMYL